MDTSELRNLEDGLARTGDHAALKLDAAAAARAAFMGYAPSAPNVAEAKAFFQRKNLTAENIIANAGAASKHELHLAFSNLTHQATLALCDIKTTEADGLFAKAREVAERLDDPLYDNELRYLQSMTPKVSGEKLCVEMCYESINPAFGTNKDEAFRLIGAGLVQTEKIGDHKRRADFLGKAQYALYELLEPACPNLALSLGHYLRSSELRQELQSKYYAIEAWSHFRDGNAYIDLGWTKKKHGDMSGADHEYAAARDGFELTLAWASENQVWYAMMFAHERLGVANTRLRAALVAAKHFEASLEVAAKHQTQIEQTLRDGNLVRCKIGMGNLKFESATDENRETNYKEAGLSFVDAHNLAKKIGDSANERIADGCLRRLFEKWPEGKKQFPGIDEARSQA